MNPSKKVRRRLLIALAVLILIFALNVSTGFAFGMSELTELALIGAFIVLIAVVGIIAFSTLKHSSFLITLVASIALISIFTFVDLIVETITMFLMVPLVGLVFVLFGVTFVTSVTAAFKYKKAGPTSLIPIILQVGALLLVVWVPLSYLYINANFALFKDRREQVVAKVNSGELKPNVNNNPRLISLGGSYPNVSIGGNEISVYGKGNKKYVFFYTYRGFMDENSSGFIYVPPGGNPQNCSKDVEDQPQARIVSFDRNWFYVSHYECE